MPISMLRTLPVLLLVACGGHHPLEGSWKQELPNGAKGMHIDFDTKSDKIEVGLAPRADDTHEDIAGTYSFDRASMSVTVNAPLMGNGKAGTWTGKLSGEHLELGSADGKLLFHHAEHSHDH